MSNESKNTWDKKEVIGLMAATAYHVRLNGYGFCSVSHHLANVLFEKFVNKNNEFFNEESLPELKDILLCFLRDQNELPKDASAYIADDRFIEYNDGALQDAIICIEELFKLK